MKKITLLLVVVAIVVSLYNCINGKPFNTTNQLVDACTVNSIYCD